MLKNINQFLKGFFYTYILGKRPVSAPPPGRGPVRGAGVGMDGPLVGVDALLVRDTDNGKLILVIDTDLGDIPVWADWDREQNIIGIAQHNGAYATLSIRVEADEQNELKGMKRIVVVTKPGDVNIVHQVPFIARDY